ncbi:prolyl aminopeptidase [Solirhodobacter olei]|uniref:prolyl aminopeptidase n=1 Tax=Solirhodobacter olei TaxID=2493082 RepID=UPI000FD9FF2E|nr:prolyl aminopeptidase [Solirhodobacter olei]
MSDELQEPFASGHLAMGDGAEVYWEASGNPEGRPALYLHGGPGSGLGSRSYRSWFDPERYLLIGLDQRGCGRSRPLAGEVPESLGGNRTEVLIADIERLRAHLGIDAWLVAGVSWGATLALAYALEHPGRVEALALAAVATTSRAEVDWLVEGMGRIFPEAWEAFEAASGRREGERVVKAYARRLSAGTRAERLAAAQAWNAWEEVHVSLAAGGPGRRMDEAAALSFATLVTHYFAADGFLGPGSEILPRIGAIGHVPAVLIHGRRDISLPVGTAWALHRRWPASRLVIVEDEGHGGPKMMAQLRAATDRFAAAG